ncbi:MAG TPA: heme exporter protein CcmD [Ideonella sp.]|uniref:heme exporter protein CcmD n=1 Tax=Ideonella sp. TaxID=1929293 RepID=UPI002C1C0643|nr:heme exporter protein CcmD [Ideonella sp.]HSI48603.1 heme exporter protein CcmD [Ideonella sp.]
MPEWLQPAWQDWASFWQMGRHGVFVWSGVALVAAALAGEWLALAIRARRLRAAQATAEGEWR